MQLVAASAEGRAPSARPWVRLIGLQWSPSFSVSSCQGSDRPALARIKDDLQSRTPLVSIFSLQRIARVVVGAAVFLEEPASFLGTYDGFLELILLYEIDE
jgi:hypothetical protein